MTRVEDFASGVVGLIGNEKAYNEAFNVCGDEAPSFKDVLNVVGELLHREVKTIDMTSEFYAKQWPSNAGEILGGRSIDAINSNQKLKKAVRKFKQRISIIDGIQLTIESYMSNNYQYGIDYKFDGETDRIIKNWCMVKGINTNQYNLKFVDYLRNANNCDKLKYYIISNKDNYLIRLFFSRLIKRIS